MRGCALARPAPAAAAARRPRSSCSAASQWRALPTASTSNAAASSARSAPGRSCRSSKRSPSSSAERVEQDRLAGAGLAGQHREAGIELDVERFDDDEIADRQRAQHVIPSGRPASVARGAHRRAGPVQPLRCFAPVELLAQHREVIVVLRGAESARCAARAGRSRDRLRRGRNAPGRRNGQPHRARADGDFDRSTCRGRRSGGA